MAFDPPEIDAGGTVRVVVQVREELSGVRSISGTIENPSSTGYLPFSAGNDIGGGQFEGKFMMPATAEEGVWRVRQMTLEDKARNRRATPYSASTPAVLTVRNPAGDSSPPELIDAYVEQPNVQAGSTNRLILEVRDDKSEVASVSASFSNQAGTARIDLNARAESATRFVADVNVPENADCGEWRLTNVVLRDSARNRAIFNDSNRSFARATFFVSFGSSCDNEPPQLRSFIFDPMSVENAEASTIRIIAAFDDQSGTASAYGRVRGPVNADGKTPSIAYSLKEENGQWLGTLQMPQHAASGRWTIDYLQVEDKAKNRKIYRADDPMLAGAVIDVR